MKKEELRQKKKVAAAWDRDRGRELYLWNHLLFTSDVVGKPSPQLMDIKEMSMSKEKGSKKDNTRCNCMVINLYDVKEN